LRGVADGVSVIYLKDITEAYPLSSGKGELLGEPAGSLSHTTLRKIPVVEVGIMPKPPI
jgi:hypothetical protein